MRRTNRKSNARLSLSQHLSQQVKAQVQAMGARCPSEAARMQASIASAPVASDEAIRIAKEKRFTLSARMLSEQNINVKVINDPNYGVASFNINTKQLTLNEGETRMDFSNPVKAIVNHRASLYHEVDHALFTRDNGKRKRLTEASKDAQAFNLLVNVLEDGRIEWLGKQKFPGSADFLNTTLLDIVDKLGKSEIEGLHLYVRTGMFRNKTEAAYWQPYQAKIDEAIRKTTTSKMLDVAFEICEAISERKPSEPEAQNGEGEQGEGAGEQSQGEQGEQCQNDNPESAQSQPSDEGESEGESESGDEGESEGEGEGEQSQNETDLGNAEEGEGEAQGEGESDSSDEGEESDSSESPRGAGSGDNKPEQLDNDTHEELKAIVEKAVKQCEAEAQADYEAILAEAEAYEPEQAYLNDSECGASDELASAFNSLLVESARTRYYGARAGLLNQATLASALTSRKCFHKRDETPDTPHVALLLDVSYSMIDKTQALTSAARVLNGALRKANINVKVVSFGGHDDTDALNEYRTIPTTQPLQVHGGTPTGKAMSAANDWLEAQGATRGLIIVVTDGAPNSLSDAQAQLQRAEASNAYVVGVLVGIQPDKYHPDLLTSLTSQFNDHAFCHNVADLPTVIQPMLAQFIASA